MNRKQFIQSRGATCRNWTWSWSFINHDDQLVIFGAWDVERDQERAVIGVRLENGNFPTLSVLSLTSDFVPLSANP